MTAWPGPGHAQNTTRQVPIHNLAIDRAGMSSAATGLHAQSCNNALRRPGNGGSVTQTARRFSLTTRDRRMLAGAYWPVVAFAASLVTARTARSRRHRQEAAVK